MSAPDQSAGARADVARDLFERPRVPIRTPAVFLADAMRPSICPEDRAAVMVALQRQYARTRGYVDTWGHVALQSVHSFHVYRFVPVHIWERTAPARADCRYTIPSLVAATHGMIRELFRGRVPWGVTLAGITSVGRMDPHALFSLVLHPHADRAAFRAWAKADLLADVVPALLTKIDPQLVATLQKSGHSIASFHT